MIASPADIIKTGLILHLDTINTNCHDRVGTNINNLANTDVGSFVGGTTFNSTNGSINLNGTTGYMDFSYPITFDPDGFGNLTMSVWLNNVTSTGGIANFYGGPSFDNGIELELYLGNVYIAFSSTAYGTCAYATTGAWVNFTFVYDGAGITDSDKLKFYINGVETTLSYVGTLPATIDGTNVTSFLLGLIHATSPEDRYLECSIGHLLTYNTSLTAIDVMQNYDATKNWFGY